MTERLHFHFSLSCIGEGNGNPLQYSCLENPRDGGAWWAAVSGVAQSRTRLKRLSISRGQGTQAHWPSELGDQWQPLGSSHKSQGTRYMCRFLSRGYWHSGAWQRDSMKTVPTLGGLCRGLQWTLTCVCFIRSLPFRTLLSR